MQTEAQGFFRSAFGCPDDEIEITYNGTKIIQPTAFYMSEGSLCARFPYCPHRGWVRGELETDADQADYVCRFTEYVGLYADQTSRVDDFFWPLGMTCN